MLLTKGNAALSLLFDMKLLDHADTEALFGSDFPGDRTDMQARQKTVNHSISVLVAVFERVKYYESVTSKRGRWNQNQSLFAEPFTVGVENHYYSEQYQS